MATITSQYKAPRQVPEQTSWVYRGTLIDPTTNLPVPLALINTLTLTIYVRDTLAVVNGVNNVDIKNTGRGTIGATDGSLRIHFVPEDAQVIGTTPVNNVETHIALIRCKYNALADGFNREIVHEVTNLAIVT